MDRNWNIKKKQISRVNMGLNKLVEGRESPRGDPGARRF